MDFSIWGLLKKPTSEEVETAERIKRMKKSYPSLRVVGRGTIRVEPREINGSEGFKAKRATAVKFVNS